MGTLILFLLVVCATSYLGISNFIDLADESAHNNALMVAMKEREVEHLNWVTSVLRSMIEGTILTAAIETDHQKCAFGKWYYSNERANAEKTLLNIRQPLKDIEEPHRLLHESVIKIRRVYAGKDGVSAAWTIFSTESNIYLGKVRGNLNEIKKETTGTVDSIGKRLVSSEKAIKLVLVVVSLLALFFGSIVGVIIVRSIMRQLGAEPGRVVDIVKSIEMGDFTVRIDVNKRDKHSLLASVSRMKDNLENLISNLIVASQNLAQAVEQISSGNQNLSQRTSEQASSLEEVASTIEEATANIKQNAENAIEANTLAGKSSKLAEEGGRITSEAVASINEINQASKKIGEITGVINEISFQTNLLALNAAVEAARAGEQGRGFAVVASEIRNLAQRSGNAAKEIAEMIKDTVEKVANGTMMVNNSGESLKEIIKGVKDLNRFITEISVASDEQMKGMDQINVAIAEMDTMTQQNAALVEETASASEEMSNQAQELLAMTEKFVINENLKRETSQKKHKELHLHAAEGAGAASKKKTAKIEHKGGNGGGKDADIKKALESEGFEEF